MLNSDAQMHLSRVTSMQVISRKGESSLRPTSRTTDVNAFLDRMGLGGQVRRA